MNKLDKQIQKIINTDIFFAQNEEEYAKALSKIKQSILKAIMDKIKERVKDLEELIKKYNLDTDINRLYEVKEFESVIKEVLK